MNCITVMGQSSKNVNANNRHIVDLLSVITKKKLGRVCQVYCGER